MNIPIDIVVVTYFRFAFTRKVLQHIRARTKTPFRLIVVDNGSQDGTREYLQNLKDAGEIYKLKLLNKNIGLQAAKNIGLEHVESKYFVDTDNDCLCPSLEPDWLEQLVGLIDVRNNFGAISLRPQVLVGVGPIFKQAEEVVENNVAGGSFRIMRTDVVKTLGGWRSDFENRSEEWEISGKLKKAGYKVGYSRDIFTYHMFGEFEDKKKLGYNNWGYPKDVKHYHNKKSRIYARDVDYDSITCEPKIRLNE